MAAGATESGIARFSVKRKMGSVMFSLPKAGVIPGGCLKKMLLDDCFLWSVAIDDLSVSEELKD